MSSSLSLSSLLQQQQHFEGNCSLILPYKYSPTWLTQKGNTDDDQQAKEKALKWGFERRRRRLQMILCTHTEKEEPAQSRWGAAGIGLRTLPKGVSRMDGWRGFGGLAVLDPECVLQIRPSPNAATSYIGDNAALIGDLCPGAREEEIVLKRKKKKGWRRRGLKLLLLLGSEFVTGMPMLCLCASTAQLEEDPENAPASLTLMGATHALGYPSMELGYTRIGNLN